MLRSPDSLSTVSPNTYMRFKIANNIVVILQSASLSSQGIGVDLNVVRAPVVI